MFPDAVGRAAEAAEEICGASPLEETPVWYTDHLVSGSNDDPSLPVFLLKTFPHSS